MSKAEELSALLAEIAAGPEGPEIGAFFDFDGTLIAGYSAEAFVLDAEDVAIFRAPESVDRSCLLKACESCPVDALTVWDEAGEQIVP